jgi:hypothetical protein
MQHKPGPLFEKSNPTPKPDPSPEPARAWKSSPAGHRGLRPAGRGSRGSAGPDFSGTCPFRGRGRSNGSPGLFLTNNSLRRAVILTAFVFPMMPVHRRSSTSAQVPRAPPGHPLGLFQPLLCLPISTSAQGSARASVGVVPTVAVLAKLAYVHATGLGNNLSTCKWKITEPMRFLAH